MPFDTPADEWWVRLAISDPASRSHLEALLGFAEGLDVISALRSSAADVRREALAAARKATGELMVAALLGVEAVALNAAADEAARLGTPTMPPE